MSLRKRQKSIILSIYKLVFVPSFMKKIGVIGSLASLLILLFPQQVQAVCPVCTVVVCAGLGLSRWLKVDDLLSGVWVGGLLASSLIWLVNWLKTKRFYRKIYFYPLVILFYFLTIYPLFISKIIGHPQNKICFFDRIYVDRLFFALIVGNISFIVGVALHNFFKTKNSHKSFFPFQKVVIPIALLVISSFVLYLIK